MENPIQEKRQYQRYDTEIKVYFRVSFDIETIVKFMVIGKGKKKTRPKKYSALSKNVSVNGLCFNSDKKLNKGDILFLEVFLPKQKNPISMEGEVRWSQPSGKKGRFDTGLRIATVDGKTVSDTIYTDETYHITWSAILESVFGNFRKFAQKQKKS